MKKSILAGAILGGAFSPRLPAQAHCAPSMWSAMVPERTYHQGHLLQRAQLRSYAGLHRPAHLCARRRPQSVGSSSA